METTNLTNCENIFEDLVRLELKIDHIKEKSFDLLADIRFREYKIPLAIYGDAIIGLKKGKLKVKLNNGAVPLANIKLDTIFQTEVEIDCERGNVTEKKGEVHAEPISIALVVNKTNIRTNRQRFTTKEYKVSSGGGSRDPYWDFEAKFEDFLAGLSQNTELATVNVEEKPCSLTATFEVENIEDICLTKGSFLWGKNINMTKIRRAAIERGITKSFIKELLQEKTYLSRVELAYG